MTWHVVSNFAWMRSWFRRIHRGRVLALICSAVLLCSTLLVKACSVVGTTRTVTVYTGAPGAGAELRGRVETVRNLKPSTARNLFKKNCMLHGRSVELEELLVQLDHTKAASDCIIPRVLHRTWKTSVVPRKWREAVTSCLDENPGVAYCLWTDADLRALIAARYAWFLPTYAAYAHPIQRVDAARYFILLEYGGLYLDLDLVCLESFEHILANHTAEVVLAETDPTGVTNAFMAAIRGSPFNLRLVTGLSAANRWYGVPYATVIFSTGPMFVTRNYWRCEGERAAAVDSEQLIVDPSCSSTNFSVIPINFYKRIYFRHLVGNSWHRWDAQIILFLGRWLDTLLYALLPGASLLLFLLAVTGVCVVRRRRRNSACSRQQFLAVEL